MKPESFYSTVTHFCTDCHAALEMPAQPSYASPMAGLFITVFTLGMFFIGEMMLVWVGAVIAIIIWTRVVMSGRCASCKSSRIVPINSPRGQALKIEHQKG